MGKQKIEIEYPLAAKSYNIVWEQISSAHGLERWLADHVTQDGNHLTFTWGELWTEQDTKSAHILEIDKFDHIRLKWDDDDDEDTYWEMRIGKSELTGHLNLQITDYALPEDTTDLRDLWDGNLDRLHRASGL